MKKRMILCLITGLAVWLAAPCFAQDKALTVAVLNFTNIDGKQSVLGRYFTAEAIAHLAKNPRFRVVEREQIDQILAAQDFDSTDFVDEKTASRLGELLGVEALFIGTLTKEGFHINVNMKLIDVTTGQILSTGKTRLEDSMYRKMYNEILPKTDDQVNNASLKTTNDDPLINELSNMFEGSYE